MFGSQLVGSAVCPDKRPNFSIFTHFLEIVTLFVITGSQPVRIRFWFCPLYLLSPLLPPPRNSILFSFELTGSIPLMWAESKIKRNQAFCSVPGEREDQRVSRLEEESEDTVVQQRGHWNPKSEMIHHKWTASKWPNHRKGTRNFGGSFFPPPLDEAETQKGFSGQTRQARRPRGPAVRGMAKM